MHWKQKRDFFYSDMTPEAALEAGFFHDSATEDEDFLSDEQLAIECTPINFAAPLLKAAKKPAILIACGCFAPIHRGHIDMMRAARKELQRNGFDEVVGYFAPDHDEYVQTKTKDAAYSIDNRIRYALSQIKEDWLAIDCWAGLIAKTAVNFTDVMMRLREYILTHLGREIPVFLVVGSDNARFAKTFRNAPDCGCVIITRPSYSIDSDIVELGASGGNIFIAQGFNSNSSTAERARNTIPVHKQPKLLLRLDDDNPNEQRVIPILEKYFREVNFVSAQAQEIPSKSKMPIISLDELKPAKYNLGISRLYDTFGMNRLGFMERPNHDSILTQIARIPKGDYNIWDDDKASGGTMRFVRKILSSSQIYVHQEYFGVLSEDGEEILDARDFLLKGGGGLVMKGADGAIKRVPYILPYVNPAVRASIGNSRRFSKEMWELNQRICLEGGDLDGANECGKYALLCSE